MQVAHYLVETLLSEDAVAERIGDVSGAGRAHKRPRLGDHTLSAEALPHLPTLGARFRAQRRALHTCSPETPQELCWWSC